MDRSSILQMMMMETTSFMLLATLAGVSNLSDGQGEGMDPTCNRWQWTWIRWLLRHLSQGTSYPMENLRWRRCGDEEMDGSVD